MKQERFIYLINQYANKVISDAETAELKELLARMEHATLPEALSELWLKESSMVARELVDVAEAGGQADTILAIDKDYTVRSNAAEGQPLKADTDQQGPFPRVSTAHWVYFLRKWGWAAASIFLMLTVGGYFRMANKKNTFQATVSAKSVDIAPGKAGAILTLGDGSQVVLDSLGNGVIAAQGGAQVLLNNGQLAYDPTGETAADVVYNTMSTPKGRQFNVLLPDGTRAWLNAASSITYPTVFNGKERAVKVTGEAYFEVTKNAKMPFRVNVNNRVEVEVLGTSFNVNSYEDEGSINTTLLEGSVRVAAFQVVSSDRSAVTLKPGQQAQIVNADGRSENAATAKNGIKVVNDADVTQAVAWKNGFFAFRNTSLQDMMRQLARWYNLTVIYEGVVNPETFTGKIDRSLPLSEVLEELTQRSVHYKLEGGNRIVILP